MRRVQRLIAVAILCLFASPAVRTEEPPLPAPPRQNAVWTPPETRLPRFFVTATQTLFEQGLADPRGCEYRSIRIRVGNVATGRGTEIEATGWAFPAADGGEPSHAVAWNGLVYPLIGVGEPADLDADIEAIAEPPTDVAARRARMMKMMRDNDEAGSVALGSHRPLQICLLLRLGRADLAEALWTRTGRSLPPEQAEPGAKLDLRSYGVSYLTLANDYAQALHQRSIGAHLRADDALALADARALDGFWRAVDVKAAEMGFVPRNREPASPSSRRASPSRYIDDLNQAAELLADQERRARERANPPPPAPEGGKVASLIRGLDQITTTRQGIFRNGNFAGPFEDSPTIKALIDLGDDAVEPLIRDLRDDDRLTRRLDLGGGPFRDWPIMRANRAAYLTLTKILKVSTFGPRPRPNLPDVPADPNAVADEIQAYWDKHKDISMAERWYRTLADDQAGTAAWLEAAGYITQRTNVTTIAGGPGGDQKTQIDRSAPGVKPPLRGESLRQGHSPTVAELMIRRIEAISNAYGNGEIGVQRSERMGKFLAVWDRDAGAATPRDLTRLCRKLYAQSTSRGESGEDLANTIVRLITARAVDGDRTALREYAEWIKTTSPRMSGSGARNALEPLRLCADDPDVAAAADWLFNDPQSPWVPLIGRRDAAPSYGAIELIASPMIEVPAFRKMLLSALADRAVVGKAEIGDDGTVSVTLDSGHSEGDRSTNDQNDPDAPPIGAKADLRACDYYAWKLASRSDAPHFNPCWPEPKRDAAVAEIVEFLKRKEPSQ